MVTIIIYFFICLVWTITKIIENKTNKESKQKIFVNALFDFFLYPLSYLIYTIKRVKNKTLQMSRRESRKNRIRNNNKPSLDLHGVTYDEAKILTEDFALEEQYNLPVDIITGNSEDMKLIVKQVLNYYGFSFQEGDLHNSGYIKITN